MTFNTFESAEIRQEKPTPVTDQVRENVVGVFVTLVVPVYNEEESLKLLVDEIFEAMNDFEPVELILVDDASDDNSLNVMRSLKEARPDQIKIVHLAQRSGQTFALKKGLDVSTGKMIVTMDADLQNDPHDIPGMIKKLEEGYECVCGWRKKRQDTWLKAILSKTGNRLQRWLTGLTVHDVSCTLRVYRRGCISRIPLNWEGQHRFIPLALSLQGYRVAEVESHHRDRAHGYSKYSHRRIFRVIRDFFRILKSKGCA